MACRPPGQGILLGFFSHADRIKTTSDVPPPRPTPPTHFRARVRLRIVRWGRDCCAGMGLSAGHVTLCKGKPPRSFYVPASSPTSAAVMP